jgi:hypothetical protein
MLAQVKKLAGDDFAGRLGAWWNGRDYVAPVEDAATPESPKSTPPQPAAAPPAAVEAAPVAEAPAVEPEPAPPKAAPVLVQQPSKAQVVDGGAIRIRALETLWGEGRFSPGSFSIDTRIVDATLELADRPGDVGFIGADAALLQVFAAQSDRRAIANEWRSACLARVAESVASAVVTACEVDRPRSFVDGSLPAVVSMDAFAFSDHKAGLVGRVFRALDAEGRWVFVDTTRRTKKTPPQAFASAWAEPLLATNDELAELLTLAGFKSVRRVSIADQVLSAARQGYANLSRILERAAEEGLAGREGALLLQELAWEAQSWRARIRALEGGALEVNLWVADKTLQEGPLSVALGELIKPDDAGAADTLFDQG